jgi:AraC-like DNA-binding protein
MIHSLAAEPDANRCAAVTRRPSPALRPYVVGYSGFRTTFEMPLRRRILPLNLTTLIVDFTGPVRLATGPRGASTVAETAWRCGVTIGLTPAGVGAIFGTPMSELVDATVPLEDLLGHRVVRLADRLAEAPDWSTRFTVLDGWLTERIRPGSTLDGLVAHAWWRLQEPADRIPVGRLAGELGVSRRYLEKGFRKQIGLSPRTVSRIARFQHAVTVLSRPHATLRAAADCGFADQPHLSREVRAFSGMTPTELFAFVQDTARLAD